jgi:vacuolar-type H+-ATPase subunit H
MEQTAVEWLVSKLPQRMLNYLKEEIEQAKEIEKQQIIDAYNENENYMCDGTEAEQYYNETFKNK